LLFFLSLKLLHFINYDVKRRNYDKKRREKVKKRGKTNKKNGGKKTQK
jgi:hypothetical protein